jgi:DNA-binding transcriptional MerR regulator
MIWFAIFLAGIIGASWAFLSSETALLVTVVGVILGVLSLLLGWRSDKTIREIKELIKEWREGTDKRLAQNDKMIEEGFKRVERIIEEGKRETQRMIEEGRKETRELLRWIEETLREIHKTQGDIARILEKMDERAEHRHRELMGR